MCLPVATLALVGAGISAVGTGFAALQANAQAKYRAKLDERNAQMEREAGQQQEENTRQAALKQYREIASTTGQQRAIAAANGVSVDFGTAGDVQGDTQMLGREDVNRIYQQGAQKVKGYDINASNYVAQASADRQAGTGALIKGAFDMGSTVLGGVTQFKKLKAAGFG